MKQIMNRPDDLERTADIYKLLKGSEVLFRFYDQGIWKEHYVPKELKDWRPERTILYRCYWRHVVSGDPMDQGTNHLLYIEEY